MVPEALEPQGLQAQVEVQLEVFTEAASIMVHTPECTEVCIRVVVPIAVVTTLVAWVQEAGVMQDVVQEGLVVARVMTQLVFCRMSALEATTNKRLLTDMLAKVQEISKWLGFPQISDPIFVCASSLCSCCFCWYHSCCTCCHS